MDDTDLAKIPTIKRKHIYIIGGVTLFLLLIAGFFLISSRINPRNSNSSETGSLGALPTALILEGGGKLSKNSDFERTIQNNEAISEGDIISNDTISRSAIIFPTNSYLVSDIDSKIKINSIKEGSTIRLELLEGKTFIRVIDSGEGFYGIELNYDKLKISSKDARFYTQVIKDDKIIISVVKGSIKINLEDNEIGEVSENKIVTISLKDISSLNADNLSKATTTYTPVNDTFEKHISCIDGAVTTIVEDTNNKRDSVKNDYQKLTECKDKQQESIFDEDEKKNRDEAIKKYQAEESKIKKVPPEVTAIDDQGEFTTTDELKCTWKAKGDGLKGYEYSVGTVAGSTNVADWKSTTETSVVLNNIGMQYPKKYFCNVRAIGQFGTSSVKSTNGLSFDNSTATIQLDTPNFPGRVTGRINSITVTTVANLEVTFYIKRADGKYVDAGGNAVANQTMLSATIGGGNNWASVATFADDGLSGGLVYAQVKNKETGKILDQTTVTIP